MLKSNKMALVNGRLWFVAYRERSNVAEIMSGRSVRQCEPVDVSSLRHGGLAVDADRRDIILSASFLTEAV